MHLLSMLKLKSLKLASLLWPRNLYLHRKYRFLQIEFANQSLHVKRDIDRYFQTILTKDDLKIYNKLCKHSKSQCRQDLIIALIGNWKPGTIIEVGATDGILLSNSFMLEQILNWECVLVEPCRAWKESLKMNRANSKLIFDAVSHSPDLSLNFTETEYPELSGVTNSLPNDFWSKERNFSVRYQVDTTTLDQISDEYCANGQFLAVTIDIEGGEIEALHGFTKNLSQATLLIVENNGNEKKVDSLDELMLNRDFVRLVWPFNSYDSWYLRKDYFEGCSGFVTLLHSGVVQTTPSIFH